MLKNFLIKNKKIVLISLAVLIVTILFVSYFIGKEEKNTNSQYYTLKEKQNINTNAGENQGNEGQNNTSTTNIVAKSNSKPPLILYEMAKNERDFANAMKRLYETYPDYAKFPIDKDRYVILMDLEKDKYRIILQVNSNSSPDLIKELTSKALEDLSTTIGKQIGKNSYYVLFLDNYENN